jgi:hypothetical protein
MMTNLLVGSFWSAANGALNITDKAIQALTQAVPLNPKDQTYRSRINRTVNGRFLLPDPDLIMRAYRTSRVPGTNPEDPEVFLKIPDGMIILSSFLVGQPRWLPITRRDFWAPMNERSPQGSATETMKEFVLGKSVQADVMTFDARKGFDHLYQGYLIGDNETLYQEMLQRRNRAWQTWRANSGSTLSSRSDLAQSSFSSAPFMVYDFESLQQARSRIMDRPVTNLGAAMPANILPRTPTLQNGQTEAFLDPHRVLIFGQQDAATLGDFRPRGLNFGIQASAGEPGAFRRYPIQWTAHDEQVNSLEGQSSLPADLAEQASRAKGDALKSAVMIPFGGWTENVSVSAVAHLTSCQNADLFVRSAKDAPGNDFQAGALVTVVRGPYDKAQTQGATEASKKQEITDAEGHFQRITAAAMFSRNMAHKPWVENALNFDAPCSAGPKKACSPANVNAINNAIVPLPWGESRLNLAIVGYQATMLSVLGSNPALSPVLEKLQKQVGSFYAFGQNIHDRQVLDLGLWTDNRGGLGAMVPKMMGRSSVVSNVEAYLDAVRNGLPVPN